MSMTAQDHEIRRLRTLLVRSRPCIEDLRKRKKEAGLSDNREVELLLAIDRMLNPRLPFSHR